jgi:hypothetical protein
VAALLLADLLRRGLLLHVRWLASHAALALGPAASWLLLAGCC